MNTRYALYGDDETYLELLSRLEELRLSDVFARKGWYLVCDATAAKHFFATGVSPERVLPVLENAAFLADDFPFPSTAPNVLVVATRRSEQAVLGVLRRRKLAAIGLLSDVVPRIAAGAEPRLSKAVLDAMPQPARRIAIMSTSASSAAQLTQALQLSGLPRIRDHFQDAHVAAIEHRRISQFEPARWWSIVVRIQTVGDTFATNINWDLFSRFCDHLTESQLNWFNRKLSRFQIIYIKSTGDLSSAVGDQPEERPAGKEGPQTDAALAGAAEVDEEPHAGRETADGTGIDGWIRRHASTCLTIDESAFRAQPAGIVDALVSYLDMPQVTATDLRRHLEDIPKPRAVGDTHPSAGAVIELQS